MIYDEDAWHKYPHHHKWFNKLYIAELMGYNCGPDSIAPTKSGLYVVRPIYNLSGMGVGAKVVGIVAGDVSKVPPGYFWCEYLSGVHYSATYSFTDGGWVSSSCWVGLQDVGNLSKFTKWTRSEYAPQVPPEFYHLWDVDVITMEFKGDRPIEVHLRGSPDPDYDTLVPVWKDSTINIDQYIADGYDYIDSYDDANGFLEVPRVGFLVKYTAGR